MRVNNEVKIKGTEAHWQIKDIKANLGGGCSFVPPDEMFVVKAIDPGTGGQIKIVNKLPRYLGLTLAGDRNVISVTMGDRSGHVYTARCSTRETTEIEILPFEVPPHRYAVGGHGRRFLRWHQRFFGIPCEAEAVERARHSFAVRQNDQLVWKDH